MNEVNRYALTAMLGALVEPTKLEWEDMFSAVRECSFPKGEILVDAPGPCNELHFVVSGVCRHFFVDPAGNEITSWFSQPGTLAADYRAFTEGTPAIFTIQAVSEMTALAIDRKDLQRLYDGSKTWERMGRLINQYYLSQLIERNNNMFLRSAKERYSDFAVTHGHLLEVVQLRHIASYLGMTLETLSRIRSGTY